MKATTFTLLIPLLLGYLPSNAQQAEKTLVKSFNVTQYQTVVLDLEGEVQLKTWNEDQMRILMTITLQDGTETVLKSLVQAGRYMLETKDNGNGELTILTPGLLKQIKLRSGNDIGEQVSFVVYAPKKIHVKTRTDETTGMLSPVKMGF